MSQVAPLSHDEPDTSSPEQRAAINHGRGPALILAAPGSGKTWVITQRFMRLAREGVDPEKVLCLTFNVKAGDEMRGRVRDELGPLLGDPALTTYHAWALKLVSDYGRLLGDEYKNVRVATGAEQWIFISEAIEEALGSAKSRVLYSPTNPYANVGDISRVIQRAKQEGVSPTAYMRYAREKLVEDTDSFEARQQLDIAKVYTRLQQKYRQAGLLDHDDCINVATRLFSKPEVRKACREYEYVMVDEYQDTNLAQARMVERLASCVKGNVMVVADDDQAIYGFRGAWPKSITRLRAHFSDLATLQLPENRRSTPEIIDVNRQIIAMSVVRQDKVARAIRPSGPKPLVVRANSEIDEAAAIVDMIQSHLREGSKQREIGVLFRNNRAMDAVKLALQAEGIPYIADGGNDYFRAPDVRNMKRLLEAIANVEDEQAVLACLTFNTWGMSNQGKQQVITHISKAEDRLIDLLEDGLIPGLSDADRDAGQHFAKQLRGLIAASAATDIRDLFEMAADVSGSFDYGHLTRMPEIMAFNGNAAKMRSILAEFLQAAQTSEKVGNAVTKNGALIEVVKYLRVLEASGGETMETLPDELDGVRLSTIHQAKGREWRHVIVAGCSDGTLPARWRPNSIELPRVFVDQDLDPRTEHFEGERRLFYVAGTRARDSLTYTWPQKYSRRKTLSERSGFIDSVDPETLDFIDFAPKPMKPARKRLVGRRDPDMPVNISHSQIEAAKTCERKLELDLLGVPQTPAADAEFGKMVHETLKLAMLEHSAGQKVTTQHALWLWETVWKQRAGAMGKQMPQLHEHGKQMIRRYVASAEFQKADIWHHRQNFSDGSAPPGDGTPMIEYRFEVPFDNNIYFTGRFDRVDNRNGVPVIVDYKSGRPKPNTVRQNQQLRRYAVAASKILNADEVVGQIHWLEDGTVSEVQFDAKDLKKIEATLVQQLTKVRDLIVSDEPATLNANDFNCSRCPQNLYCDLGAGLA